MSVPVEIQNAETLLEFAQQLAAQGVNPDRAVVTLSEISYTGKVMFGGCFRDQTIASEYASPSTGVLGLSENGVGYIQIAIPIKHVLRHPSLLNNAQYLRDAVVELCHRLCQFRGWSFDWQDFDARRFIPLPASDSPKIIVKGTGGRFDDPLLRATVFLPQRDDMLLIDQVLESSYPYFPMISLTTIPSVSGQEAAASAFVAAYCRAMEFDDVSTTSSGNVIASARCARRTRVAHARVLCLTSHLDTVPILQPTRTNGSQLFATGAVESKASVAAMLGALDIVVKLLKGDGAVKQRYRSLLEQAFGSLSHLEDVLQNISTESKVVFAATVSQQTASSQERRRGTPEVIAFLSNAGISASACIIGQPSRVPTSNEEEDVPLCASQLGRAVFSCSFRGIGRHAAFAWLGGTSAEYVAAAFKVGVAQYSKRISRDDAVIAASETREAVGPGIIPSWSRVDVDIRYSNAEILGHILTSLRELSKGARDTVAEPESDLAIEEMSSELYPPFDYSGDPFCRFAESTLSDLQGGLPVVARRSAIGSDGSFYAGSNIPVVICGPGVQLLSHAPNEHITFSEIERFILAYVKLAIEYLSSD